MAEKHREYYLQNTETPHAIAAISRDEAQVMVIYSNAYKDIRPTAKLMLEKHGFDVNEDMILVTKEKNQQHYYSGLVLKDADARQVARALLSEGLIDESFYAAVLKEESVQKPKTLWGKFKALMKDIFLAPDDGSIPPEAMVGMFAPFPGAYGLPLLDDDAPAKPQEPPLEPFEEIINAPALSEEADRRNDERRFTGTKKGEQFFESRELRRREMRPDSNNPEKGDSGRGV